MSKLQRRFAVILTLGVFGCSVYLLATASPWLLAESARWPGFPLGTLIAWAGIVSLPMASFLGFHRFLNRETRLSRISRSLMTILLFLCAAWGFVAYGLAANWAFNFSNTTNSFRGNVAAGEIFWAYSQSIVALTLLASAVLFAFTFFIQRGDR
ncbi:MAG: hypothetical protein PVI83_09880 [Lysobacterales bacterium]